MPIADCRFVPKEMKGQLFNRLQEREVSFELGGIQGEVLERMKTTPNSCCFNVRSLL